MANQPNFRLGVCKWCHRTLYLLAEGVCSFCDEEPDYIEHLARIRRVERINAKYAKITRRNKEGKHHD